MSRAHTFFFVVSFGFVSGVILRSFFSPEIALFLAGLFTLSTILFFADKRILFLGGACAICFGNILLSAHINALPKKEVSFIGEVRIVDTPEHDERGTTLIFKHPHGKTILYSREVLDFQFGDVLFVEGTFSVPEPFLNELGRDFAYPYFLKARGVSYAMYDAEISFVRHDISFRERLVFVRDIFLSSVSSHIKEPAFSLLAGMLVGLKSAIPENLMDSFRISGLVHIVVLSGYNMTIVAESIRHVAIRFSKKWSLVFASIGIILFGVMAGGSATVVRASGMALLAILAKGTGRVYEVTIALTLMGVVMILWNPFLVFDPSFTFSFTATLGLIHLSPFFERKLTFITEAFGVRGIVATTIGAQLGVLPLLLYYTGALSTVSLFANILVLPLVPLTMLFGFLLGLVGMFPLLPFIFSFPTELFLSYIIWIGETFSQLPFAQVSVSINVIETLLLYIVLFILWYVYARA